MPKVRKIGRVVVPIEAFITALVCWALEAPFAASVGLVAVVVVTDTAHVLARAIESRPSDVIELLAAAARTEKQGGAGA